MARKENMKRIGFINGLRIRGPATNISRVRAIKHALTGAVSMTAAPNTKATYTGVKATATVTKNPTLGLTNRDGGRNFVAGKVSVKNTATAKHTCNVKVKTLAGTQKLATITKTLKTFTGTFKNTVARPVDYPGTLVVKVKPAAGKVTAIKVLSLSVNALTTMMF